MATPFTLPGECHEEPGRLQSMESQRVGQDRVTEDTHKQYQETVYQIVSYNEDCSDHHISAVSGYLHESHLMSFSLLKARNFLLCLSKLSPTRIFIDRDDRSHRSAESVFRPKEQEFGPKLRLKLVSNSTHENEDF